jgi:hypothetical protein
MPVVKTVRNDLSVKAKAAAENDQINQQGSMPSDPDHPDHPEFWISSSSRIVFSLPEASQLMKEQLCRQLTALGPDKLGYAVVLSTGTGAGARDGASPCAGTGAGTGTGSAGTVTGIAGVVRLATTVIIRSDTGACQWTTILPALETAQIHTAEEMSDAEWKSHYQSTPPGEVILEIGTLLTPAPVCKPNPRFQLRDAPRDMGEPVTQLKGWQRDVLERLLAQNKQQVLFVVDRRGGRGASTLARCMTQQFSGSHQYVTSSSTNGMILKMLSKPNQMRTVGSVSFDMHWGKKPADFPWEAIGCLKKGVLPNGQSYFHDNVKVVVFAHFHPGDYVHKLPGLQCTVVDLDEQFAIYGASMSQLT